MPTRSNRHLRCEVYRNVIGAGVQAVLAWAASLIDAGVWMLFAANLAGGAATCAALGFIAGVRLVLRKMRKR